MSRKQVFKNPDGSLVELLAKKVRCPRCHKWHKWPTEDKLCRRCEGEYTEVCRSVMECIFGKGSNKRPVHGLLVP